ncbi:MAG: isocitrate/isopropylmalate family dehydrogenase [Comamonadaceae bacterium]|nr:isocitrate/isopropylmalate family dehydrogenase [Comamonadaceae bacterium]
MTMKIAVLPGDGIGPEIVAEAVKVLERLRKRLRPRRSRPRPRRSAARLRR